MENLKMGIKLLRYTYGIKRSIALSIIFCLLGVIIEIMDYKYITEGTGALLMMIAVMYPLQLISSLSVTNFVQTSKWKKKLQTAIPTIINFICILVMYMVLVVLKLYQMENVDVERRQEITISVIAIALLAMTLSIYCSIAFKFMFASILILIVGFFIGISMGIPILVFWDIDISFWQATGIGVVVLMIGTFIQYGVSLLMYKYPMAKSAQPRDLQKYM